LQFTVGMIKEHIILLLGKNETFALWFLLVCSGMKTGKA